jgi:two-component system sensor histidine kinase KdpD
MDRMRDVLRSSEWAVERPLARASLCIGLPAIATIVGFVITQRSTTVAALIYVMAVLIVSGSAGPAAGSCAALASFLALNFFFTPPLHTLRVNDSADVSSLIVFFVVAVVVGGLFSALVSARLRTEKREAEAQLSTRLATRLLAGEGLESVLRGLARGLSDLFDLTWCDVRAAGVEVTTGSDRRNGPNRTIPIATQGAGSGEIAFGISKTGMSRDDMKAIGLIAGQMAIALERMEAHAEARTARLDLETSQLRTALLSSVTHDLRTPLSSITASVTSLIDAADDISHEARDELLDTIKSESVRLNRLLSNLLDLSRLRAGALVPSPVRTSMDEIIEGVLAHLRTQLDGRDIDLVLRDGLPELEVDVVQIDQLLTNLVENAMKFSPRPAPVQITVSGWEGGVRVRVSDKGPGIAPDRREEMFEPFARGDEAAAGTGLGLAIARAVAIAHGGRLWIEAAPGGGTAAVLELPARVSGQKVGA